MNTDSFTIILVLLILAISYRMYYNSDYFQLKCIVSSIDGEKYCVRDTSKIKLAADRLATVNQSLKSIIKYCDEQYPNNDLVKRMKNGYNSTKIMETLPNSEFTAYSENKGEKLAFCLHTKKNGSQLIDINTLTYVAIHELAHIATKSVGHTPEFWKNFKFLLTQAEKINIYKPIDYKNNPEKYCGMTISDNPYYDVK